MEYRQLGGSGFKVPVLTLGTGTFGGKGDLFSAWGNTGVPEATRLVDISLEAGLTMFESAGKIRYLGCSNFSGWHLMKSLAVAEKYGYSRYVAHQAYYSLVGRSYEWELMPLGLDQKVGAVVWSPLGWAKLNTDVGPQISDDYLYTVVDAIDEIAKETGKTVPQIALNWLLQRPTVSTLVIGARNEDQLRANLGSVGWNLTPEQVAKLDAASTVPLAYPYFHQRGFTERNPPPVCV